MRVAWRTAFSIVGTVIKYLSLPLILPLLVAVYYSEPDFVIFLTTIGIVLSVGWALERLNPDPDLGAREAFIVVSMTWLLVSVFGALPYLIEAHGIPFLFAATAPASTLANPANALFESMSGFTTTGATVMGDISFQTHSRSMLLWRQFTQWLGGMGIVVLAVAILPKLSVGGAQLMDAEAPGVGIEKLTPRIAETARVLWLVYFALTVLEVVLLYGLHVAGMAPNMTLYNAVAHGFTTMPTGGFSPEADSIAAFSAIVQWVVIPFMIAAGTNFALFWHLLNRNYKRFWQDTEFRGYLGVLGVVTAVLAVLLFTGQAPVLDLGGATEGHGENALRQATFQAVAIVTTTGYATSDFAQWSEAPQFILLVGMFLGGSGGSTGGSVKIIRWLVIFKATRRSLYTAVHPDAIRPVRLAGTPVDEDAIHGIFAFTLLYLLLFAVATILIGIDVTRVGYSVNTLEAMSSVAATLGNVGPGFGSLGPFGSYLAFPWTSKVLMVFLMWVGRLEIFPVLVLLTRGYWTD